MFDRYTPDARQALFFARYEASLAGATALEVEHLWLGVLQQSKRLVKRLAPKVNPELIRERIALRGDPLPRTSLTTEIPLSAPAERVLLEAAGTDPNSRSPIKVDDIVRALIHEDQSATSAGAA